MRHKTTVTATMFLIVTFTMATQLVAQDGDPFAAQPATEKVQAKTVVSAPARAKTRVRTKPARPARPVTKPRGHQPSARTISNNRIRATLSKPGDLIYDAEPFGDVRSRLTSEFKLNVVIDPNLEGVLDDDTETTANFSGIPLSDGLREMLRNVDATYVVRDGMLLIISIDDEYEPGFEVRQMIDVKEALRLISALESDRIGKPYKPTVAKQGFYGGKGGGAMPEPSKEKVVSTTNAEPLPVLTAEQLLMDTIVKVVEPDAWEINGSGCATLTCVGGVLFVQSSEKMVEAVRDLVADFEYQINSRNK